MFESQGVGLQLAEHAIAFADQRHQVAVAQFQIIEHVDPVLGDRLVQFPIAGVGHYRQGCPFGNGLL